MLGQTALWSTDQLVAIAADLAPSLPTQVQGIQLGNELVVVVYYTLYNAE